MSEGASGDDEDLGAPSLRGWGSRVGIGFAVVVLIAAVVVGLVRHADSAPDASPGRGTASAGASNSGAPSLGASATAAIGPAIPDSRADADGDASTNQNVNFGRHRTPATLYGLVSLLNATCITDALTCTSRSTVPGPVRSAVRTVVPGCTPVLDDHLRRGSGPPGTSRRTLRHTVQRTVLCVHGTTTLLVSVAPAQPAPASVGQLDGDTLVFATRSHGRLAVQVFLQNHGEHHPSVTPARTLAADPRLLAGIGT